MIRPSLRRLGAVAAAFVVTVGFLASSGSAQTTPPQAAPTPTRPTAGKLTLASQTAWVAPGGTFKVSLLVGSLPPGAKIVARLYASVSTPARLAQTAKGEALGGTIQPSVVVPVQLAPLSNGRLDLSFQIVFSGTIPPYGFWIDTAGVYPFSLSLVGSDGNETDRVVTHLIRLAPGSAKQAPLAVALLVPIHTPVSHDPNGSSSIDPTSLTAMQGLAADLSRQPSVPLTLAPTPETIDALAEHDRSTGTGLINSLAAAVGRGRELLNNTYVDVDRGAWVGQGLGAALSTQFDAGAATITSQLRNSPDKKALLVDPSTTAQVLTNQVVRGIAASIVPSDLLVPVDHGSTDQTITQAFDLTSSRDDRIPAVAVDSRISRRLAEGDNPTLAAHEVVAEIALLSMDSSRYQPCVLSTRDASGCSRGIALALPSSALAAEPALGVLLDAFSDRYGVGTSPELPHGAPLASAVTVTDLFSVVDRASASFRTQLPGGPVLARQLAATNPVQLGTYPAELASTTLKVAGYRSMVPPGETKGAEIAASLQQVLLSSGAVGFDDATRARFLAGVRSRVSGQLAFVTAPGHVVVTLTSSRARIPLSISNALDYPVTVVLRLSSAKLEFPNGSTQVVNLPPGQPTRIEIPVQTRASGSFPLDVGLWTPDGNISIADTRFTVRSTSVSGVGLALTIAAGLFLVLWWVRNFRHTRRDRRLVTSGHPVLRSGRAVGGLDGTVTGDAERTRDPGT